MLHLTTIEACIYCLEIRTDSCLKPMRKWCCTIRNYLLLPIFAMFLLSLAFEGGRVKRKTRVAKTENPYVLLLCNSACTLDFFPCGNVAGSVFTQTVALFVCVAMNVFASLEQVCSFFDCSRQTALFFKHVLV